MDGWVIFIGLLVVIAVSAWLGRRTAHSADTSPPQRQLPHGADPATLLILARTVDADVAHPSDLLADTSFHEGVVRLSDPGVTLETLVNNATGGNEMLACMALEALASRERSPELLERLDKALGIATHYE